MPHTFEYDWTFALRSRPEQLWPFIADTNRFNRDCGLPHLRDDAGAAGGSPRKANARRDVAMRLFGQSIEWTEEPFEWVWPRRFAVLRRYRTGPIAEFSATTMLEEDGAGGTKLRVVARVTARTLLGRIAIPLQVGLRFGKIVRRVYEQYDRLAQAGDVYSAIGGSPVALAGDAEARLGRATAALREAGVGEALAGRLREVVRSAHDLAAGRLRPYELADLWRMDRREVLEGCLHATRAGLLELRWNVMCPMCRGGDGSASSLSELTGEAHCPTCNIDFGVNFDRNVEVTFRPAAGIRAVDERAFCIGGPQMTPHVVAQRLVGAGESHEFSVALEPGRYRLRALEVAGAAHLRSVGEGEAVPAEEVTMRLVEGWGGEEVVLARRPRIRIENGSEAEQLFILERQAWTDRATTAAEVTLLQTFRDLFTSEALRPGEQMSVGTIAILFTDLRASTELYRAIGDAPAFARVMSHFDVLREAIAAEGGAVVKTIGDAVMAAFGSSGAALRAASRAQGKLAGMTEPLLLKAGIHCGPCIAVTLNGRLDYFGTSINLAARLVALSTGQDVVMTASAWQDAQTLTAGDEPAFFAEAIEMSIRGHGDGLKLVRVRWAGGNK